MAHIEINADDLSAISNDISEIKTKMDNLKSIINTKFEDAKEQNFYSEGFKKINDYLESHATKMDIFKTKLESYQNDIMNIEKTYSDKFSSIAIPNFQSDSSSLVVVTVSNNIPQTNNSSNTQTNTSVSTESQSTENKSEGNDFSTLNTLGALAGVAGIIGGGSLAAAGIMKSKENKEDEDEEENEEKVKEE